MRGALLGKVGGMSVVLMVVAGCSPQMRAAKNQAQIDFDCPGGRLDVSRRSLDTYTVHGCGRSGIYQCPQGPGIDYRFCVNLALLARERAAEELRCELEEVRVQEISPFIFRSGGCGREIVYHCEATDGRPRCLTERSAEEAIPARAAAE